MSFTSVNLASRPFSNQTPVLRATVGLGLIALLLIGLNVALYWSFFSGSGQEARSELARIDADIARAEQELNTIDREIRSYDLNALSSQVEFLNLRIAERTFAWSQLFEDLAEVMPVQARLLRLSPRLGRTTRGGAPTSVQLTLEGAARNDEAVLRLIDSLFEHPRFEDPNPSREVRRDGELRFVLTVIYRPPLEEATEEAEEAVDEGGIEATGEAAVEETS